MRRAIRWIVGPLLFILGAAFATVSISIYSTFGLTNFLPVSGFQVDALELSGCGSVVMDVNSISIESAPLADLVGAPEAYLTVALSPEAEFTSSLVTTEIMDQVLLGRSVCNIQVGQDVTVQHISQGVPSLLQSEIAESIQVSSGVLSSFPLPQTEGVSIFIELPVGETSLVFEGLIVYPNAQLFLQISAGAALLFIFGALITWFMTRRKSNDSGASDSGPNGADPNE